MPAMLRMPYTGMYAQPQTIIMAKRTPLLPVTPPTTMSTAGIIQATAPMTKPLYGRYSLQGRYLPTPLSPADLPSAKPGSFSCPAAFIFPANSPMPISKKNISTRSPAARSTLMMPEKAGISMPKSASMTMPTIILMKNGVTARRKVSAISQARALSTFMIPPLI